MQEHGPTPPASLEQTLPVIAVAMLAGTTLYGAMVALFMGGRMGPAGFSPLEIAAVLVTAAATAASRLIPPQLERGLAHRFATTPPDAAGLAAALGQCFLIGYALLEGAALASLTLSLIRKSPVTLGCAAFSLVGMALAFPTRARLAEIRERLLPGGVPASPEPAAGAAAAGPEGGSAYPAPVEVEDAAANVFVSVVLGAIITVLAFLSAMPLKSFRTTQPELYRWYDLVWNNLPYSGLGIFILAFLLAQRAQLRRIRRMRDGPPPSP